MMSASTTPASAFPVHFIYLLAFPAELQRIIFEQAMGNRYVYPYQKKEKEALKDEKAEDLPSNIVAKSLSIDGFENPSIALLFVNKHVSQQAIRALYSMNSFIMPTALWPDSSTLFHSNPSKWLSRLRSWHLMTVDMMMDHWYVEANILAFAQW